MAKVATSNNIDLVRRMTWFDGSRARAYSLILLAITLGVGCYTILTAHHGIDRVGKPLGTDFLAFWSASKLALGGDAAAAYDLTRIYVVERSAFSVDPGLSSFLYPPPFLMLVLPLGLLPYFGSLILWLTTTALAYFCVIRRWLRESVPTVRGAAIAVLAYPAVLMNAGHGQNGFLTAALLGSGLWSLDRRPWVAGVLLGALVIKPQMAFAIPILMIASGRWRVVIAGTASALLLCAASWFILGPGAWAGFLAGGGTARGILEQGLVDPGKMVSVFAALQVLHGSVAVGYAAQALATAAVSGLLVIVARRKDAQPGGHAAVCAAAGGLMSPFFLDYDLTVLLIPMAWLLSEALRRGFLPWEKAILLAAYVLPLFVRDLALELWVPIGPVIMIALFAACARAAVWPDALATRQPVDRAL